MNKGNFSKIKWVVLCICLLAGGFFLLKNLNIQSVDQYDKESDRIAGQIQIKEAATGSSVTAAAVAETTETPPLSSASPDKGKKDKINIRSGPGTNFKVVGQAYYGVVFAVVDKKGRWRKIRHDSGLSGWIQQDFLWGI